MGIASSIAGTPASLADHFEMSFDFFDAVKLVLATSEKTDDFAGIPVRVSRHMPKDTAWLIDGNGKIVQIFKMEKR